MSELSATSEADEPAVRSLTLDLTYPAGGRSRLSISARRHVFVRTDDCRIGSVNV